MRGEDGSIITTLSKTTAVENGAARMYAVFASAFNGIGGAAVSGIICTINGCGSGGGSSQTAISISGSEATQVLQAAIAGGAGCTTGACGSTPTPVQSGQTAD
jgi:hypothetical protein